MKKKHIGYIDNGINLDHIPCGNAFYIMKILDLHHSNHQTGVGLNLPSKKNGVKDLIKIEGRVLTVNEIDAISLFCIGATLSTITNYEVSQKITISLPKQINATIVCPNKKCISHDHVSKFITSKNRQQQVCVSCHYCEQTFLLEDIREYNI
jgi:aspartate carbamoyltransferase regulatory subunit